jgi:hypothetical protein
MPNREEGPPAHHSEAPVPDGPDGSITRQTGDAREATDVALFAPPAPMSERNESGASVLAARAEAEIKARAVIAINRPRNFERFRKNVLAACQRSRFADAAIYSKPTGGKAIEGLSIRFAEECARHYGNLDISSMVVGENDDYRTIECAVADLETNMVWRQNVVVPKTVERKKTQAGDEVIRRRTNAQGQIVCVVRATADQVFMQQNALISKTIRTLILNIIPSDVKEEAYEMMETVLSGEIRKDPAAYREKLKRAFFKIKIVEKQLVEYLGKSLEDANEAELFVLARIGEGIAQGEGTWAEVMAQKHGKGATVSDGDVAASDSAGAAAPSGATDALKQRLGASAQASAVEPARITEIRAKPEKKRTDDENEDLRQYDLDHPVTS